MGYRESMCCRRRFSIDLNLRCRKKSIIGCSNDALLGTNLLLNMVGGGKDGGRRGLCNRRR